MTNWGLEIKGERGIDGQVSTCYFVLSGVNCTHQNLSTVGVSGREGDR